eukprot:4140599-Amphidinium_carterae.1
MQAKRRHVMAAAASAGNAETQTQKAYVFACACARFCAASLRYAAVVQVSVHAQLSYPLSLLLFRLQPVL